MAPLDEPSHGMQFGWHIAASVDQSEQVLARSHRVLPSTSPTSPGSSASAAKDPVDQFEHDPLGVGAGQLQVAAKELPCVDIRGRVQRVNRVPARGRRLRQAIGKDAIEPCLVTGACAIEQRRQRAKPLGRDRPPCVGIAEPLVLAHQNGDRARLVVRCSSVPRRLSLTAEQFRRRGGHVLLRCEVIEHRLM